jgi:hypothetical protein
MPVTVDRADVIHFAGRHRLSPALRDGAPVLVPSGETGGRCGWAPFFAALRERRLAVSYSPDDPASVTFVSDRDAAAHPSPSPSPGPARGGGVLAEARRFLAALRHGRLPRA